MEAIISPLGAILILGGVFNVILGMFYRPRNPVARAIKLVGCFVFADLLVSGGIATLIAGIVVVLRRTNPIGRIRALILWSRREDEEEPTPTA